MPSGIEIYGTSGIAQITSETLNFTYLGKATLAASGLVEGTVSLGIGSALPSGAIVMVGVKSNNGTRQIRSYYTPGDTTVYADLIRVAAGDPVTIYFFASKQHASSSGAGIEIFDASGNLSYSSTKKPLKIVGVLACSAFTYNAESANIGYVVTSNAFASSEVATMQFVSSDKFRYTGGGTPDTDGQYSVTGWWRYSYCPRVSGGSAYVSIQRFINFSSQPETTGVASQVLVIDVAGY